MPEEVTAVAMSKFIDNEPVNKFEELDAKISRLLITQSAQITGQMIATAITTFHADKKGMVKIPIEGSLFWGAPGYASIATRTANESLLQTQGGTSDKFVHIAKISHAGRVGAGVAALATLLQ
jgi:hexokinase